MFDSISGSDLVVVFIALVISITLHEAMHAFTGYWLGDDTAEREGRITLNPLKHVDPLTTILLPMITLVLFRVPLLAAKPVPFNPSRVRFNEFGAALVGLAGPLTNLALALFGAGLAHLLAGSVGLSILRPLVLFTEVNIGLFVFNMIPLPPLDGSRLLYAFAPEPLQEVMAKLEQSQIGILVIFFLILAIPAFGDMLVRLNQVLVSLLF